MERLEQPGRIVAAILVGALTGGVGVGLWVLYLMLIPTLLGLPRNGAADPGILFGSALGAITVAAIVFLVGILALGGPVWLAMHRFGANRPWNAAAAGGLLVMSGAAVLTTLMGDRIALTELLLLGLDGAIVGWVIQRIAYRQLRPPRPWPVPPS